MKQREKEHIQFLDGLRGLAILVVFLYHALAAAIPGDFFTWADKGWLRHFALPASFAPLLPVTYGWAGVAIFFALSGFCIHLSYARGVPGDFRAFFARRFFRIYPPYLLALAFFSVFTAKPPFFRMSLDWGQIASHLLLVQNFSPKTYYGINAAFWSVAVEVQLYLIYPLLLAMLSRLGWRRTLGVTAGVQVALGAWWFFAPQAGAAVVAWLISGPLWFWFSWAVGVALADEYLHGRPLPFRSVPAAVWLFLGAAVWWIKGLEIFSFTLFAVGTVSGMAGMLAREGGSRTPGPAGRHLRALGLYSYSFYLLHAPLVYAVAAAMARRPALAGHPLAIFAACVATYPILFAVSMFFYRWCEMPSIAAGKLFVRWLRRSRPDAPAVIPPLEANPG